MSRPHQPLQTPDAPREQDARPLDVSHRPLQQGGWRTVRELRDILRFPSDDACRGWLRRHGVIGVRRGRVILVDGRDVDRVLRGR